MRLALAFAAAALALVPGALARPAADPGVGDDSIVIGGTVPLSGPASFYAPIAAGANAYFRHVNDTRGGVHGRKIEYRFLDDAYNPAQTVQQTRRLVEQERVFAIFNSAGTDQSMAVREYLNRLEVPQLFVGTGASRIARERARYPWTLGYLPSFFAEGRTYGRFLAKRQPRARIAVLHEQSEFGSDLLRGLRAGIRGSRARVVAVQRVDPTTVLVNSHVARLRSTRADTLMIFVTPTHTMQAFIAAHRLGWHPQVYVAAVSIDPAVMEIARFNTQGKATENAVSLAFLKDPTNPRWARDTGVRLYRQLMARYLPRESPAVVTHLYGMAVAFTMVDALRRAGPTPTRQSLLRAATSMNERTNPFLVPGIAVRTGRDDYFPIEQAQMYRFKGKTWRPLGGLVSVRETS